MKHLFLSLSIIICIIFTSITQVSAKKGAIDGLLNLEFGVEEMDFTLSKIEKQSFSDPTLEVKHKKLREINNAIIDEFNKKYVAGEIDYYSAHGLATEQKQFAYLSTQLFKFLDLKLTYKTKDFDQKILENYYKTRTSYSKIVEMFDRTRR